MANARDAVQRSAAYAITGGMSRGNVPRTLQPKSSSGSPKKLAGNAASIAKPLLSLRKDVII